MRQLEAVLRQLAERAEPLPTEVLIARIETELGWAPSAVAETEEPTMVTRQQPEIETPTPPPRSRRGPLVAAAVAVVVILAGVGIAFATGAFESERDTAADRVTATELVDTWIQGWLDYDPELVTSVFTDDGVYIERVGDFVGTVTKDDMVSDVLANPRIAYADRIGELTQSGDGTYTWVQEFDSVGNRYRGEMEIELKGDLAERIEWLNAYERIGPAAGYP